MQAETQAKIVSITATIELLRVHVGYDVALARLAELEAQSAEAECKQPPECHPRKGAPRNSAQFFFCELVCAS